MPYMVNRLVGDVITPPIAQVRQWVAEAPADRELLDVSQAVPSYPAPPEVLERLAVELGRPQMSDYTEIGGMAPLREALAAHLGDEYGAPIAADAVAITAGCNQAFCIALSALAGPGDEVLLPVPYYFNHQMWLEMQGIRVRHVPFDESASSPDLDRCETLASDRTRALVLVTPNNPTGMQYSADYLQRAYRFAERRGIALVLDETYKDFRGHDGAPHHLFEIPDWGGTLVQLYSFSKAYSLAGYRVGSIVCGDRLMREVRKVIDCVTICAARVSQTAALLALEHAAAWRDRKAAQMVQRIERLRAAMEASNGFRLVSAGAYFAYLHHPFAGMASAEVAHRLAREHGVLCVPGSAFGPAQEGYLRFAFANLDEAHAPELVARLNDCR